MGGKSAAVQAVNPGRAVCYSCEMKGEMNSSLLPSCPVRTIQKLNFYEQVRV